MKFLKICLLLLASPMFIFSCDKEDDIVNCKTCVEGVDTTVVSAKFPLASKFVTVKGSKIHYIDEAGKGGQTFVLLHGAPTSTYLWRNVVPHLKNRGRVVAFDMIGMGKSDKPDIDYRVSDHIAYINGAIEALALKNIILVVHDWGGPIGFNYARIKPDNVSGIVLFETLVAPIPEMAALPLPFQQFFTFARSGAENDPNPGSSWDAYVNQNAFIEQVLPGFAARTLTAEEMENYRSPYLASASRKLLWRFPREVPIAGEPADVNAVVGANAQFLFSSKLPKLLLHGNPGAFFDAATTQFFGTQMPNSTVVNIGGPASHFLQEDRPHQLGLAINKWVDEQF
jgi:haloalkane dehalogenase